MSFALVRNSSEWAVVNTGGEVIVATNKKTGEAYTGTLAGFNEFMDDRVSGIGALAQANVPVGIAPTGAVAANGAITLGTALPATYSNGIWLALPAGAAFTDAPGGIYWCVMSSTTVGVIYNNLLVGVPSIPASPVAIVDARTSTAYTGITTATTLVTVPVPAAMVGANGFMKFNVVGLHNNAAGAKTYVVKGGDATWLSSAPTTTAAALYDFTVFNRGKVNSNMSTGINANGVGTNGFLATAVDTSAAFDITFNGTLAAATDYLIYEHLDILVAPKL